MLMFVVRSRCRTEGVTVGSLALASNYLAMDAVEAESAGEGSADQLVDIPVNMRNRYDQHLGNTHQQGHCEPQPKGPSVKVRE